MLRHRGSFASSAHWGQSRERTNRPRIPRGGWPEMKGPDAENRGSRSDQYPCATTQAQRNSSVHPAGFPCGVLPYRPRLSPSIEQGVRTWLQVR